MRKTVEGQLEKLRDDNSKKLAEMQKTVDEKLEGTLQKRLGESFKLVSERLEQVHQGLGEMQNLAVGVGDLKRTLMNVKTRGTWAEVQLGALLEEIMSPEQYLKNANINPNSREVVEYAVRLPGRDTEDKVLLPIDAKFPQEDFERLMDAIENADKEMVESARKSLEGRIREEAKRISAKYIQPPVTTNFAILFLPTEGLYAEVIRMPGVASEIQRNHNITIAGPTTLSALLNSLRAGFHTLAIQKRTGEVWKVLVEATEEFKKYGDTWEMLRKQLATVTNTVEKVGTRTRAVERKLRNVGTVEVEDSPVAGFIPNTADEVGDNGEDVRDNER
ncbi:MAG: DNA recombination protein RmuC [Hyphomicrobiales bacterium]|nr:DNA recombination protein RmuC [Hyphomicrobiales bacterium]